MDLLFSKFKSGLQRTKTLLVRNIQSIFTDTGVWNEESYEHLEEALIKADLGIDITQRVIKDIRDRYNRGQIHTSSDIIASTKTIFVELLNNGTTEAFSFKDTVPTIVMLVGVNGSGKTTTAGKLASRWKQEGRSVLLAACDTFRAAAIEQLKIWGERVGCPVISAKHGADAASVAYDAVQASLSRKADVLLIDTAGRQHTKKGLMDELAKISRTIGKAYPGAPHETWLVVDGSTGTNALQQAKVYRESIPISGLCLTKLDGSSKGGVVVAIHEELDLPIYFIGLGEDTSDLQPFDSDMFADALLS